MNILGGIAIFFCLAAAVLAIILVVYLCADMVFSKDNYSYIMDNGTSGTADYCDNGKGMLYCTEDDRTFTVKEYSRK